MRAYGSTPTGRKTSCMPSASTMHGTSPLITASMAWTPWPSTARHRQRKRLVEEFRQGRLQVLVNVDVFSEGFDCPDVEFVQMARPTLSLAKYLQQAGRGLRRSESKESCVLIDNVGLYHLFGLPTVLFV